ncbi:MAG: NAD-dependent DNA ligase LigA [Candidatus Berkelbacteria bacterium]|nr:NAD-dependent DNA ligase LigA [Candidatus Berkelbacteria bacterium]
MNKNEAKKRIEILKKEINKHRRLYHQKDQPQISDAAYDSLFHELIKIETDFPELVTPDSPTQKVGGEPAKKFAKVKHETKMLSINDVFNFDELEKWQERLEKNGAKTAIEEGGYFVELKMDGLAASLIYENGILTRGSTRGDGETGEEITNNLKTIKSIPERIENEEMRNEKKLLCSRGMDSALYKKFEVRGEVFLSRADFEKLNQEREKSGLPKYANPRNIAAGSIRQLDPKITAERDLDFFVYSVPTKLGLQYHHEEHELAECFGFKVNKQNRHCKNLGEVGDFLTHWESAQKNLPYQTDGVVIVLDDKKAFDRLGVVGRASRAMIAYKFAAVEATAKILDIIVQVGRTGKLTPVAILEPTLVAGSTISRATLHNADEIGRKEIKIGDTAIIRKAGDVIPEVASVIKKMRSGNEKKFQMPAKCPICGGKIEKKSGEVDYYCQRKNCSTRRRRQLEFFVSKNAFGIDGLGPKIIEQLMENGLVESPDDIFRLKVGDLEPLERFAEKSAGNIIESIEKSKKIPLERFMYALGIRHIGAQTAVDIAAQFGKIKNIISRKKEDLDAIYGIGEAVGKSFVQYFSEEKNLAMIKKLQELGVEISDYHSPVRSQKFAGKSFVVTGTLESMPRDDAHKKIVQLGGKISSSVTSKTDFLVVGDEPGSKLDRARKFGTKMLSEKEFLELLK